jgi:hypothetical protein
MAKSATMIATTMMTVLWIAMTVWTALEILPAGPKAAATAVAVVG